MAEETKDEGTKPRRRTTTNSVSPEAEPAPIPREPVKEPTAVVGDGDTDPVSLASIVYKDVKHRKSLSVHHVQRRLNEQGYPEAYADRDGFYGDLTRDAVARFQKDNGLVETGMVDADTLAKLFDGDPNVTIVV